MKKEDCFRFLESPGGTAMITMILGTVAGTCLNCVVQADLRERESRHEFLQARSQQALVAYEGHLAQATEVVEMAYGLVGDSIAPAETYLELTTEPYARSNFSNDQEEEWTAQRSEARQAYDSSETEWRRRQHVVTLQMNYYFSHNQAVPKEWRALANAIDAFRECALHTFIQDEGRGTGDDSSCQSERSTMHSRLDALTAVLRHARIYAWNGFGTLKEMKALLSAEGS